MDSSSSSMASLPLRLHSPSRHPRLHALPLLPDPDETDLIPPPLFSSSKRTRLPPNTTYVAVLEIPDIPSPTSNLDMPPSPSSIRSTISTSSSSPSSAPSSPRSRARSLSQSPTPSCWATIVWDPTPQHSLRRKPSPKSETLRSLRAKESDACLQRVYNQQTLAYLDGRIFEGRKAGSRLGMVWED